MIVKNESRVIGRCLGSVLDLIDSWVISDTGSTDGTQSLIRSTLSGIPGELHQEPWVNFGHNRTRNIRHARGKADYLLLLDADHVVRLNGSLPALTATSYMLRHEGDLEYRIKRLVRGDIDWRYVGATHEYLDTGETDKPELLDEIVITDFADGGSRQDKFERDAALLSEELSRDPGNGRTVFYLAQTMRDLGRKSEAIGLYERRAEMGGWGEEIYVALLEAGVLRVELDDWKGGMECLIRAWESRPQRLEACYEVASGLRRMGRHNTAYMFAKAGVGRPVPAGDVLFTKPWVYRWGLLFELSVSSYWVGEYSESVRACDLLLGMEDLPEPYRMQTVTNREFSAGRL
ncbi:glycosyltransferase [Streptomyces sp. CNQ085]|uniref:glycosyltransferase n=1 Tax=Streptomyces sp. CNQ085 TaxID=2886944 RepID=UPI001F506363|nr:glycosyltransferase [Streptomyces sp. CNQ085]